MKKILGIMLTFVLALGLAACGGESAENAVENTLDALKANDMETVEQYLDYDELVDSDDSESDEEDLEDEEMAEEIFAKLDYKIISSEEKDSSAIVKTEITNIDMTKVMGEYFREAFALAFSGLSEEALDEQYEQIFTELISEEDRETVTTTVDIELNKTDEGWKIVPSEEFADAIMGGMLSAIESFEETDTEN